MAVDALGPGALMLCPDDGEASEYYTIAFRLAEGESRVQRLRLQQESLRRQSLTLKKLLQTSSLFADVAPPDYDDDDDDDVANDIDISQIMPDHELTRAEIDEGCSGLRELKLKIEETTKAIRRAQADFAMAGNQVRTCTKNSQDPTRGISGKERPMKNALLELARQVDPDAAMAAEILGYFYMRTPFFFYQLGLTEWQSDDGKDHEHERQIRERCAGKLPDMPRELLDLPPSQAFRIYEAVDQKSREAILQDDNAICDLLAYMACPSLLNSAHIHLVRTILELKDNVEQNDEAVGADKSSAMLANWPSSSSTGAPNSKAYTRLNQDVRRLCSTRGHISPKLSNAFTKSGAVTKVGQEPSHESKMSAIKEVLAQNFQDFKSKDPLMHITAQVAEVLISLASRGVAELRFQLTSLYGEGEEESEEKKHWFERRQAANKICEIATSGNELALNAVCKYLLKDRHWMVRQTSVSEACRIIGRLPEDHPRLRELVDMLIREMFDHPDIDSKKAAPTEVELRETHNVQQTTEKSLVKEFPTYSPKTREYILGLVKSAAEWFPKTGRVKLERFHEELGIAAPQKMGGSQPTRDRGGYSGGDTLRKARLKQMEAARLR